SLDDRKTAPLDDPRWGDYADAYITLGNLTKRMGLTQHWSAMQATKEMWIMCQPSEEEALEAKLYALELLRLACEGDRDELIFQLALVDAKVRCGRLGIWV